MDGQRIGTIVIPLVVLVVAGNWVTSRPWAPPWLEPLVTVIFVGGILTAIVAGFRGSAWGRLARRYPAREAYGGPWIACPTLHVSDVRANEPGYQRDKVRLVGLIRIGIGEQDLFLSLRLAVFNVLMPPVQVPRAAVASVTTYEDSGFARTPQDSKALVQVTYDPNFRGRIAEVAVGEPPVYLQLQAAVVEPLIPTEPPR